MRKIPYPLIITVFLRICQEKICYYTSRQNMSSSGIHNVSFLGIYSMSSSGLTRGSVHYRPLKIPVSSTGMTLALFNNVRMNNHCLLVF